jgi:hypothetical protein
MRIHYAIAGITLTTLFTALAAQGADPRLLNLVMPDATTLAGANVTNAGITPFGQFVLNSMTVSGNQELQTFITTTGFDPRHDVSEILAASSGNAANPSGVVLAMGNFQVPQITAAITAKSPELTIQTYGNATLITGPAAKKNEPTFAIAFLGTNIAIVGDVASVKAAIDRSASANSIDPALAAQVQTLSTTEDVWAVTSRSAAALLPGLGAVGGTSSGGAPANPFGQMFNGIQSSSGGVKFGSTVAITGQAVTTDAATAKSLADVIQGIAAIASMTGGQNNPEGASIVQLLQGLTVAANGVNVNIALNIPETLLESIVNGFKNPAKPELKKSAKPALAPQHRTVAPMAVADAH